jgi:hypothetical protein
VLPRTHAPLQVQSWTYSGKTRVIRAGARAARDSGVRVRELAADELTPEMRRKLQNEVTGGDSMQACLLSIKLFGACKGAT